MSKETYSKVKVNEPAGWTLDFERVFDGYRDHGSEYKDDPDQPFFERRGKFAGNCTEYSGVNKIELRNHYNGSGASAFGGAKNWPVVTSKIAFVEGEYQLAADFAKDLGAFINERLEKRGR